MRASTPIDTPPHPFDRAIALRPVDGGLRGHTRPEYANMVGPFGGVTAATLVAAAQRHPDRLGDPLAVTVNYLAPLADGAFDIAARPVRTNRTNQHWLLELSQDGAVTTTATAVFGVRRDTWSDTESTMPAAPGPKEVARQEPAELFAWLRNYDMRFVRGAVPLEGGAEQSDSTTTLWARDHPPRPLDYPALTSLCDVYAPRVFVRRGRYSPASTVSFTVYFHADADELTRVGDDFVLATARGHRYTGGHHDQSAQVWSRGGALLATAHQLVYFKD